MTEDLQQQLELATSAARDAYRDTTSLIRLLTVLGQSAEPKQLLEQTLAAVSDVFHTDVVALTRLADGQLVVDGASGLAEDDPVLHDGWPLPEVARQALRGGAVVSRSGEPPPELPGSVARLGIRSTAWVPLPGQPAGQDLLILLRRDPAPFTGSELQVLSSVAARLRMAMEERARSMVIEQLARYGHRLARHLELGPLLDEAVEQLRLLTSADQTWVAVVDGELARLRAHRGLSEAELAMWPQPAAVLNEDQPGSAGPDGGLPARQSPPTTLRVPVVRDGTLTAVLFAQRQRRRPFAADAREIAAIFANYLAVAMVNADLYRTLQLRATHDPLTGLANRVLVSQRLEELLASDEPVKVGLLFCDLDRFKAVNDFHGHEAGDDLLQQVAERLRGSVRPADLLARFGGDEFVIVLQEVRNLAEVAQVGERVSRALDREFMVGGDRVLASVSVGGVLGVAGQTTGSLMLRRADAAMYAAKERGLGKVEVFDEAAAHRALDRLDLRAELAHALERGELAVHYQPIVALATGRVVAFEALLRWHHPRHGTVRPDIFLPLAEDTGAIVPIGQWVIEQACQQLASWQRTPDGAALAISVNLAASQLRDPHATERVLAVIRRARLAPRDVWLEITEYRDAGDEASQQAAALHAAGVRFALDDFGTAVAGLRHLQRFPIEFLKIDLSFVQRITTRAKDHDLIKGILAIARSMRLATVAEGIETAPQLAALRELRCPFGQGHLLSPPLPAAEATELLRRQAEVSPTGDPPGLAPAG